MSIKIMSRIWEGGPDDRGELLVLLALADFSNDAGESWPSVGSIAKKARMDERSARRILRKLEAGGWLAVDVGGGRHGCSRYTIKADNVPPGHNAPPDKTIRKPGQNEPETRTPVSPEPSVTINEPSEGKERAMRAPDQTADVRRALIDAGATPAAVTSFLSHYRAKVRKPLSLVGAERLAGTLRTIIDSGGDADDALGLAEERGWQSVKADWYFREKAHDTGGKAGFGTNGRRQDRPDPALEQIARLARLRTAPGHGSA